MRKFILILFLFVLPSLVCAEQFTNPAQSTSFNNQPQFNNPSFKDIYSGADIATFWPQYSEGAEMKCGESNTDFLVMIPPAGCSPAVVRSDLLGDQNVPVFCQLIGAKVNPLIKVSSIKSISFKGKYSNEVAGVSFHPAQSAIRSYNSVLGSPTIQNLGYVTIILKKRANESSMPKFVSGNLTATMAYDAQNAFGTGSAEFYLESVDEADWQQGRGQASFWQGRGLLRVIDVKGDTARIAVYNNEDNKLTEFSLKTGETSSLFYFPGFYCSAGIKVKLNSLVGEEDKALLNVDGDDIWVVPGAKILDGRCSVTSIELVAGTTGNVNLRCQGYSKPVQLSLLNSLSANIVALPQDSSETLNLFNISNKVYTGKKDSSGEEYDWYLAYAGNSQMNGVFGLEYGKEFIVLVGQEKNSPVSQDLYSKLNDAIRKTSSANNVANLESSLGRVLSVGDARVKIVVKGGPVDSSHQLSGLVNPGKEIGKGVKESEKTELTSDQIRLAKEYFDKADASLKELLATNPVARDAYSTYGEQGILSAMKLIDEMNARGIHDYDSKKIELANKFLELYPESSNVAYVRNQLSMTTNYDSSNAFQSIYVNNAYHTISLRELNAAPLQNRKASLVVTPVSGGRSISVNNLIEGKKIDLTTGRDFVESTTHNPYFVINNIQPLSVAVDFYTWTSEKGYEKSLSKTFYYNSQREVEVQKIKVGNAEYNVLISDVQVKEVASVSLISELKTRSEANFTFKIGIEPRNIKLNPEKAKETSNALNETIKKWEERNAKLGKLVESWKGVCLATGLGLQVKNLFGGFTGESFARQEVMKTYKSYCSSNQSGSMSRSRCYSNLSSSIDKDITCYQNAMKAVKDNVGSQTLEQWKAVSTNRNDNVPVVEGKTISTNDFNSFEDVKSYLLNMEIKKCGTDQLKNSVSGSTNNQLYNLYAIKNQNVQVATNAEELPALIKESARVVSITKDGVYDIKNIQEIKASELKAIINNPPSDATSTPTGKVLALLDSVGDSKLGVATVKGTDNVWKIIFAKQNTVGGVFQESGVFKFTSDKSKITITGDSSADDLKTSRITFSTTIGKNCNYQYKDPRVRFYDSGSNKGMPAIVPFDKAGWYVLVPNSAGGFLSDNVKGYTASGVPTYYYICSVGPNGLMELRGGDDSCFSNNVNNDAGTYGDCALSAGKVQTMRSQAENAIRKVAEQYGKRSINVPGFGMVNTDAPMTDDGNLPYECEDFMSVDDCKILYNVCDPVICPSSRCDFGGQTKVANVIQSGVIGSLLLCSKNFVGFGGDVYVPFCLTGVHAGIEGYISILKATRDCMAQAAATGQHVGICDEITAVYKCEFFWRQAAPLMQNLIPNLAEFIYTGGKSGFSSTRGGGEYATFQASWDNMQKSLDYFKNTYAVNSFSAFKFGNVEEIGTEFCRSFVGTSLPTSGNALNKMLKPESPYQFYAQFNEIPFTEATVPATSQYKVFYHIYAGTDQGASYQVYLKNPPSSSYYYNAERVSVKVGYIAAGGQVSETKDMTLPAGYKELCVIVNGREECGFKSVTTDYGLDTLNNAYTKDQAAKTDIKTEKECIQGSASVYGLANLNPQAGIETATQPNIALNGIVRVCATENPGKGTNSVRWKPVGTCGSDNIKCWLDETSVNNAVKQVYGATGTIASAEQAIEKIVNTDVGTMTEQDSSALLGKVRTSVQGVSSVSSISNSGDITKITESILADIEKLIGSAYLDLQQAEAMFQKYLLYANIVRKIIDVKAEGSSAVLAVGSPGAPSTQVDSTTESARPKVTLGANNQIMIDGKDSGYTITNAGGENYIIKKEDVLIARITKDNAVSISSEYTDLSSLNGCIYTGSALNCPAETYVA